MSRALVSGVEVFVPPSDGCYAMGPITLAGRQKLTGAGPRSCLVFDQAKPGDFILVRDAKDVAIEGLTIDGNYRAPKTGVAWAIEITDVGRGEKASDARVSVTRCRVLGNGFGAIAVVHSRNVIIADNTVSASTDTAIAVLEASADVAVRRNRVSGPSFGVSLSSDGESDFDTAGPVIDVIVEDNDILADKSNAFGIELDGVSRSVVRRNRIRLDGGLVGLRAVATATTHGVLSLGGSRIEDNSVEVVRDINSAAFEFFGKGDISDTAVIGNRAFSRRPQTRTIGLIVDGGVSAGVGRFTAQSLGFGIQLDHANVPGVKVVIDDARLSGALYGFDSSNAYPNRASVVLRRGRIAGNIKLNILTGPGVDLVLDRTPVIEPSRIVRAKR